MSPFASTTAASDQWSNPRGVDTAKRPTYHGGYLRETYHEEPPRFDTASPFIFKSSAGLSVGQIERAPGVRERLVLPVVEPEGRETRERFKALQRWEGTVLRIDRAEASFVARLTDLTQQAPPEEGEFDLQDVPESDRELIRPGSLFYWSIGYLDRPGGQRARSSAVRFRRLPRWREDDLAQARDRAAATAEELDWR